MILSLFVGITMMDPTFEREVIQERKIPAQVALVDLTGSVPDVAEYRYFADIAIRAPVSVVAARLKQPEFFKSLSDWLTDVRWDPVGRVLIFRGELWGYVLGGAVEIDHRGERGLKAKVQVGYSEGLSQDVLLDRVGDRETLAHLSGRFRVSRWVPAFVVRKAYAFVMESALSRFRERIESGSGSPRSK